MELFGQLSTYPVVGSEFDLQYTCCPAAVMEPSVARGDHYEALLAKGSATRDFPPRSGDDHYILYTGGTTGLPKGVVWRHEDIFFAVLGGGNPAGPPIRQPSWCECCCRPDKRRTRSGSWCFAARNAEGWAYRRRASHWK